MNRLIVILLSLVVTQFTYARFTYASDQAHTKLSLTTTEPLTTTTPSAETAKALYPSLADIVEPLLPAVVNIYTTKYNKSAGKAQRTPFPDEFPFKQFNDFFEQFNMPYEDSYSDAKAVALGSGFIIDPAGLIVTNYHVVHNADEIHVKLFDNSELAAKIIGSDQRTDLALLRVDSKTPLPFVKFSDSTKARVGDWVIAIGNPFGFGGTVTTGIISSKGRDLIDVDGIVDNFIQTDAAINSGNSGGPMFNINGEVIGVNTAIISPSGTNIGIGFAIPSNTARGVIKQLKESGKVSRGRLDICIQEITSELSEGLNLKETKGALVTGVEPGGAGDKAGLKAGDVIIEFAGQPVKSSRRLQILVAETPINKEVKMQVIRGGKHLTLTAKILESVGDGIVKAAADNLQNSKVKSGSLRKNNIIFSNLTDELRQQFNIKGNKKGVVITSVANSFKNFALRVGDLVVEANQQQVSSVEQLAKIYDHLQSIGKKNIVLFIKRQNTNIFLALPIN